MIDHRFKFGGPMSGEVLAIEAGAVNMKRGTMEDLNPQNMISEEAKEAAECIDGAIADYLASMGIRKVTGARSTVRPHIERVIEIAIGKAVLKAMSRAIERATRALAEAPDA